MRRRPQPSAATMAPPRSGVPGPRWAALILVASVTAAYSNSFQGEFIFDDLASIPGNTSIRSFWPLTAVLWPPPSEGRTVDGRPLLNLSLAVNYAISKHDVWSYHVFNLIIHILATLTLFGLMRRTLVLPKFRKRFDTQATPLGLAVSLLWGLHPLQTESVTYVIQRAESMVGLFYLLTLYSVARGETAARPGGWRVAACAACLAGMATKEVMVTAPVVAFLYLAVFAFDSWKQTLRERWGLLAGLASTWLLLAALVIPLAGRGGTAGFSSGLSAADYATMQIPVVVYYLKLCFSPSPLVLDYGIRLVAEPVQIAVCGAILLVLVGGSIWSFWRQPWIGFLGSSFFLILSPSSSIVPVLTQTLAEHRMYLPLAPVMCLTVMLCYLGFQRLRRESSLRRLLAARRLPGIVLALVAFLLGAQTWLRNLDYRTALSIWTDTVDKQPLNARAHLVLSQLYLDAGDTETALEYSQRAIDVNRRVHGPHYTRGTIFLQLERLEEALACFDNAIRLQPRFAEAYQNRGVTFRRLGRFEEALADFNRALELNPELRVGYRNRALVYSALGRLPEAREDVERFQQQGGVLDHEMQAILKATLSP